ncbi:MAG: helix-hairpin-helix domain-containing protein, partial [Oscillospiraceae bacterium]
MEKEFVKLSGSVENIIFQSQDSGFTVLDLSANGEMINVIGQLLGVEVGEELLLTGYYDNHKTYGVQFKAQMYERSLPATESAITKYLSSGVIKGVGGAIAKRIVQAFGKETFEVIEKTPEKLKEIKGLTEKKIETISQNFKEIFGIRALMNFLSAHSITPQQSVEIYKKWGAIAYDLIRENPYILVNVSIFIDFSIIDSIAKAQSISNDSPLRIAAALTYLLTHNTSNGFTCLPRKKLVPKTAQMLQIENENVDDVLDEMIQEKKLYSKTTSLELIYLSSFYISQKYIATRLQLMLIASTNKCDNMEERIRNIEDTNGIVYAGLQKKAIIQAVKNDVFILTGGPGTGKTTTLNGIIEVLEQEGKTVSIAAPTGRAAKRIAEVTGREAKTIHRLLEVA